MTRTLLIVGASGRAAAASAVRAGWQPVVIDLFADEDTRAMGPVFQCPLEEYPHGFIALAERAPPGPWMYTGGLENDPDVVEAISQSRILYGTPPDVLKRVRDPFELAALVPMPAMRRFREPIEPGSRWLRKLLRGAGGFGIGDWASPLDEREYAQEFLDGDAHSALFLCSERWPAELIGVCSQLVGERWLNAPRFRYCGNIGPLPMEDGLAVELSSVGEVLRRLGVRGLAGIDFIRKPNGVRVLEVNPRYTASVELYERAFGVALIGHVVSEWFFGDPELKDRPRSTRICGKAILYAERTFAVPADHPWRGPDFADIPTVGSVIPAGQPVVTLFASADTEPECRERLMELALASAPR